MIHTEIAPSGPDRPEAPEQSATLARAALLPPPLGPVRDIGDIIDEAELLRRIPISRRSVIVWRRKRWIPHIRMGRRVLYSWASVTEAMRRRECGGAQ